MKTINRLSNEEIQYGIDRCRARLAGVMPMGYMNTSLVKDALAKYTKELEKRGVKELEFV